MRYIDIRTLVMPTGWLDRAKAAQEDVDNNDADPNDHGNIWRELKNNLALLSNDKCWYCDTTIPRSDNAVDHYRPKNNVKNTNHHGYKWLAFDYTNYRYSCTFCNSRRKDQLNGTVGGKGDYFPLVVEEDRAYSSAGISKEQPMLLDPCTFTDWKLIGIKRENGEICANTENPIDKMRAEESIEIYHLNQGSTSKKRHYVVIQFIEDVEAAKRFFIKSQTDPSSFGDDFQHAAQKVHRAIQKSAEYSGEMIFLLKGQRHSDHPWIDTILEA